MAMSKGISSSQVSDITECAICTEPFKEPKALPCIHTFCLQCLETYGKDNKPGDKVKCPLCRKEFKIPHGGFKELPNNYCIIQLMQLNQSSVNKSGEQRVISDLGLELGEKRPAMVYCIECGQHLCQPSCTRHSKLNSSKGHQAVNLKDKPSFEQVKKIMPCYCENHPSKEIKFYCYDCKMIACYVCYVKSHFAHKCRDVKKAGEELRRTIVKNIEKVMPYITKNRDEKKEINEKKKSWIDKVAAAKREIGNKYDELKSLLDSHRDQLNAELESFKVKTLKEIETREEEVERQLVILETLKRYCEEMKDKSSCDISRNANDLHARVDELVKTQEDLATTRLSSVDIMFTPTFTQIDTSNWIGKIFFQVEENNADKAANGKKANYDSTSFLAHAMVVKVLSGHSSVWGIAVIRNEVFVAHNAALYIKVYDPKSFFQRFHPLRVSGKMLNSPRLAACSHYNCLYVCHMCGPKEYVIYRVDLSNSSVIQWTVNGDCGGLSVINNYNLLLLLDGEQLLQQYTTYGILVRKISLDYSIDHPQHCVQLFDDNFVVCHKGSTQNRVCIVDASGCILQSYGGSQGSGVDQLFWPCHLAVHSSHCVFVCDQLNHRVVLLSPTLTLLGTVQTPGHQLKHPNTLYLDENSCRLYVGDYHGHVIVVEVSLCLLTDLLSI